MYFRGTIALGLTVVSIAARAYLINSAPSLCPCLRAQPTHWGSPQAGTWGNQAVEHMTP